VNVFDLIGTGGVIVQGVYGDRGTAVEALGAVLWECPPRLNEIINVLDKCVTNEPVLSIRCCLLHPIYSVLRYDIKIAADLLRRLVIRPDRVELIPLATYDGIHALCYILRGSPDTGNELLNLLLKSEDENQRLIGAFHLFREAFYNPDFVTTADALILENELYRKLAANAAANHLPYAEYRSRAATQLENFFNDPIKDVRIQAAQCFRNLESEDLNNYRQLLNQFIQSKAFEEDNFSFFWLLNEASHQIFEEIVFASERYIKLTKEAIKKGQSLMEVDYLEELILKEYAALEDKPELRRRLLDVIDQMLALNIHGTEKIIKEYERS
jgi:hypothetical protein